MTVVVGLLLLSITIYAYGIKPLACGIVLVAAIRTLRRRYVWRRLQELSFHDGSWRVMEPFERIAFTGTPFSAVVTVDFTPFPMSQTRGDENASSKSLNMLETLEFAVWS